MLESIVFAVALFLTWSTVKGHVYLMFINRSVKDLKGVALLIAILACIAWGIFYYLTNH